MPYYLNATELVFPAGVNLTGSSNPYTLAAAGSLIFEIEGEVDGYAAAAGYAVPIDPTATYAYATVRGAVKNGVMAAMLSTLFPTMGGPGDRTTTAAMCRQAYADFKRGVAKGDLSLVDAAKASGEGGRTLPRAGGTPSAAISLDSNF